MSGLILFIVAVALLGVAIYSLVSYLKERRASQLPVHKPVSYLSIKRRNNTFRSPPFSADFFTVLYCPLPKPKRKQACGPAFVQFMPQNL